MIIHIRNKANKDRDTNIRIAYLRHRIGMLK